MRTTYKNLLFAFIFGQLLFCCKNSEESTNTLFRVIEGSESGLDFTNRLFENDSINIIENEFVYNGAGVALGDLNGDGLDDIFFTGNQVENQLFLNHGDLRFENVTQKASIKKPDSLMWSSGVTILDINLDGKNDIYVCNTFRRKADLRRNLLFVNKGNSKEGIPIFEEEALEFGIADTTYSSHAQFFDHDNDGDLDLFIGVNQIDGINPTQFRPKDDDGNSPTRDRLYKNNWVESGGVLSFTDISAEAGIKYHGYSHSSIIHDFNEDGYLDIFVSNDFLSNDLLYINNQDGTYTNEVRNAFKHLSLSSMGSDIADINNDGRSDLYVTEMQPYYNKRKKLFQGPSNYQKEIFTKRYDYEQQYARNVLHLNNGPLSKTKSLNIFNDVGMLAGIQETDWSWAPLFADIDNDGLQDLLITNGFPKDVTDRDFGDFRVTASRLVSKQKLIEAIPVIKIPNFVFKNKGSLEFEDVTKEWGLQFGTFSNGAVYGDLDNDGDLDFIINNINQPALLLENKSDLRESENHWIRLKLNGTATNKKGVGAQIFIYSDGSTQKRTLLSGRGYLSQPELVAHFGLGKSTKIDSAIIRWPNNVFQHIPAVKADTTITVEFDHNFTKPRSKKYDQLYSEVSENLNLDKMIRDVDFIDFNFQSTLPHKFSQYGPSISVGDVNGDGLEDVFVPASRGFKQKWFLQSSTGTFNDIEVNYKNDPELAEEDSASLLFDADNDGDLDLYLGRGCAQYRPDHVYYSDQLLLNDGSGNFDRGGTLPELNINTSVVKASDFDLDGDLDLFVGSRVLPFSYPKSERSMILENRSEKGEVNFVDITNEVSQELLTPGLVSDAIWTDFNNDNWPDLILACEWSSLRFFKNDHGKFIELLETGVEQYKGWWNSLTPADFDNDGDMDYLAGNVGLNVYTKGDKEEPVRLYAKDLDNNGSIDPLISYYLRDSIGVRKEYLYHPWQDVVKQYVGIRKKFNSYGEFGEQTVPEMFSGGLLDDAAIHELNYMYTSWVENLGDGRFELHKLPLEAQMAPIFGTVAHDIDEDGFLDILMIGNDFGMEVQQGPADAFNGLILKNSVNTQFTPMTLEESGFYVPGNAKALVKLKMGSDRLVFLGSQNNDKLRAFESQTGSGLEVIPLNSNETSARIELKGGSIRKEEFFWGSTFMSQSSRVIKVAPEIKKIELYNFNGDISRVFEF